MNTELRVAQLDQRNAVEIATRIDRLENVLTQLAAAQLRTEERVGQLAAAQLRTEERVEQLAAAQLRTENQVRALATAQTHTEQQLRTLLNWQQGERGRRRGELYERTLARSGLRVLGSGRRGSPTETLVRDWLNEAADWGALDGFQEDADPFLADVLYWKADRIGVVEASIVVDESDVSRALRRASTLRRAGLQAVPIVIGESWADGETAATASLLGLAWKVGDDVSERFIAFRALPAA